MDDRANLLRIFNGAIRAVAPDEAVARHLSLTGNTLTVAGKTYDLANAVIHVIGGGKGAAPMAKALEKVLGNKIGDGVIAVKYGHALPLERITVLEASHPVPDSSGEAAAARILETAKNAKPEDILIVALTGGASALLPAPLAGLTLGDLQETTELLLKSGASIDEINAIRRHLSEIAGGKLAKAAGKARIIALIVSDVIGDNLSDIASGPTAPDPSSYADCLKIVEKYSLAGALPKAVLKTLEAGASGLLPETPKPGDPVFEHVQNVIIASNSQALQAAKAEAENLGYRVELQDRPMEGEARETAAALIRKARDLAKKESAKNRAPICLLAGGETTVAIKGNGKGGRNQEMALAAALEIAAEPGICALFAGTDGTDGPTDAAGGFAFPDSAAKMTNPQEKLANNDSYPALEESGDLLKTGPTLTNVMDIAIILAQPK